MNTTPLTHLHRTVWVAMLAAMIVVGAMLQIPLGSVPITLQTLFIVLAGLILGPVWGTAAMALYLAAGAMGLPVFAGGKAGLGHFQGPTGGYLIGYLGTAFLSGCGGGKKVRPFIVTLIWVLLGLASVYGAGVLHLRTVLDITFEKAIAIGFVPYIPGDLIKIVAAIFAYRFLQKRQLLP